ncbi:hypothetical protein [Bacillus sp. FSL K6-3431]|uniref:hypothetical protein n=1 Tax=Bacillus sp. FSL K6-3431 TaxID=2921500 RepID=UPI0030FA6715
MKSKIISTLICLLFLPCIASASWAYIFVVWDGYVYVISDESVEEVGKRIGKVTNHSDKEGTYSGTFSNVYKKGTIYYEIKGVSTDIAIAVEEADGMYKKAIRGEKYAGNSRQMPRVVIASLVILPFGAIVLIRMKNKLNRKNSKD